MVYGGHWFSFTADSGDSLFIKQLINLGLTSFQ